MCSRDFPAAKGHDCKTFRIVLRQGKTNKAGRAEYASMIRSEDVYQCSIGAVAQQLVLMLDIDKVFDLNDIPRGREHWYPYHLVYARNPGQPMHYETMRKRFKKIFFEIGIHSSKSTHMPRGSAARILEEHG